MPRSAAYFGPAASSSVTHSITPRGGGGTGSAIVQGIGDLAGALMYKPEHDPDRQLAEYRRAQTEAERAKMGRDQGTYDRTVTGQTAQADQTRALAQHLSTLPPEQQVPALMDYAAQQVAAAQAAGLDPKEALIGARTMLNVFDPTGKIGAAFITGQTGNAQAKGSYFNDSQYERGLTDDRETDRLNDGRTAASALAVQESQNTASRYGSDKQAEASMYGSRQSAGASKYGSDRQYQASTRNNALDNSTTRRGQDLDYQAKPGVGFDQVTVQDKTAAVEGTPATNGFLGFGRKPATPGTPERTTTTVKKSPLAAGMGGLAAPAPVAAGGQNIPEGATVRQGGKTYQKVNGQMVEVR